MHVRSGVLENMVARHIQQTDFWEIEGKFLRWNFREIWSGSYWELWGEISVKFEVEVPGNFEAKFQWNLRWKFLEFRSEISVKFKVEFPGNFQVKFEVKVPGNFDVKFQTNLRWKFLGMLRWKLLEFLS